MKPLKKWKIAIIIWLAIYPAITSVFLFFGKHLNQIEFIPFRTLIVTLVLVPIMVFFMIPTLQKLLAGWLKED